MSEVHFSNTWHKSRTWSQRFTKLGFAIEISHHTLEGAQPHEANGWCLYAFIYQDHPLFDQIESESEYFSSCLNDVPFHGGCTFVKFHQTWKKDGTIGSKQIGCDYSHYRDDYYMSVDVEEEPPHFMLNGAKILAEYLAQFPVKSKEDHKAVEAN